VFAPGTTVSSSGSLLMVSVNLMPCASMLAYHPPFVGSSSQMALGGGSWRPDARKVPLSATREIGVVQLAEVGGRAPLLVPILLGGPSVLQGFLPLAGRWRVTTGRRSYGERVYSATTHVVEASMSLVGDSSSTIRVCLQLLVKA